MTPRDSGKLAISLMAGVTGGAALSPLSHLEDNNRVDL